MPSEEKVLELVGHIYEAAADEQHWPAFLEKLADAMSATATTLIYHDLAAAPRATSITAARMDPYGPRRYVEYYGSFDPYRAAHLTRFSRAGPEAIYVGEQLIPKDDLERTEFFNDFSLVYDIVRHVGAPIAINSSWACNLACHRPAGKQPFGPEDVRLLRHLWPHLQRAIQFHRKFAELEGQQRASLDALDRLSAAVILLDQTGRILLANREAHRIFEQNDGLSARKLELAAARGEQNRELRRAIVDAAKGSRGEGTAGGMLVVDRPSGKRSYVLLVAPVGRQAFSPDLKTPAAAVFVTDPERQPETAPSALARIFALTAAESRLVELLMQGETVVRAAERLGVSHNTVRTHLQRIYQKTRASHQGDLVRLILLSMPGVSGPLR
jgi:DNA-binding CsgD family transcriptional regulator/PAS domain-containing protein